MDDAAVIDVLRELLAEEQQSLLIRLVESGVFVAPGAADGFQAVTQMANRARENCTQLAHLILSLGGIPGLTGQDVASADLHYQSLERLLARLILDREALVQRYVTACRHLSAAPTAYELVCRLLACHRGELHDLQQIGARVVPHTSG
ncbi:MAG: hypothetical protein ACE5HE_09445 [Phycisphaerae bacterium]